MKRIQGSLNDKSYEIVIKFCYKARSVWSDNQKTNKIFLTAGLLFIMFHSMDTIITFSIQNKLQNRAGMLRTYYLPTGPRSQISALSSGTNVAEQNGQLELRLESSDVQPAMISSSYTNELQLRQSVQLDIDTWAKKPALDPLFSQTTIT